MSGRRLLLLLVAAFLLAVGAVVYLAVRAEPADPAALDRASQGRGGRPPRKGTGKRRKPLMRPRAVAPAGERPAGGAEVVPAPAPAPATVAGSGAAAPAPRPTVNVPTPGPNRR